MCSLSKEQSTYYQGRQFKMYFFFFFQNYTPFSTKTFCPRYQAIHSQGLAPACSALVLERGENIRILWEKKKLQVPVLFSCSPRAYLAQNVSKDLFLQCLLTHYHTMPHFDALKIYSCGKHCENRRNCL